MRRLSSCSWFWMYARTTGYAINPARDLGPRIAHFVLPVHAKGGSDWSYAWIPVIGPIIGGILGAVVYKALWPVV